MMKLRITVVVLMAFMSIGFANSLNKTVTYKCLIQLTNYGGEGAYVVLSLIDPNDQYVKTLSVNGDDEEWYEDIPVWWEFSSGKSENIDGITGASINSGGRKVAVLDVDASLIDAGYKLRFETAVEDQEYYSKDLEVDLTQDVAGQSLKGNGYIRYVKLIQK